MLITLLMKKIAYNNNKYLIEIMPMKVVPIITYKVNDANNTSENDNDEDNDDKNVISINIR